MTLAPAKFSELKKGGPETSASDAPPPSPASRKPSARSTQLTATVTTAQIRAALRKRWTTPEWAFLEEVPPANGAGATRFADAIAVNLWPSRGHQIAGFEIKVSRADWLKELRDPAKSASVQQYCDVWYIVAGEGIVESGELPTTWGLIEVRGMMTTIHTPAPKLTPTPITKEFFAALIRRAHAQVEELSQNKIQDAWAEVETRVAKRVAEESVHLKAQAESQLRHLRDFEKRTGLSFNDFEMPPASVVTMAKALLRLPGWSDDPVAKLRSLVEPLKSAATILERAVHDATVATDLNTRSASDLALTP